MRLVLASNNANKLREFSQILGGSIEIVSQREAGCSEDPEETGETFEENAYIKAHAVLLASGRAAIADDSGLEVDALGGEPGVRSARYTGSHDDADKARRDYLLAKLAGEEHRKARFVSAICCCFPDGGVVRARGVCEGVIALAERGENGFGYDAIFVPEGKGGLTMAELTDEEKNAISHRGAALRAFAEELRKYYADNK